MQASAVADGPGPQLDFTDITESAGIEFTHVTGAFGEKWMPETLGGGGAFFDYDGDGWQDILLVNSSYWPGHEPRSEDTAHKAVAHSTLFRNRGAGAFDDVTEHAGLAAFSLYGMGATVADYDGDGDADIFITAVGKDRLLRNDGGVFTDVTDAAGVGFSTCNGKAAEWEWSLGATWVDYDRDDDLDLFVCNYVKWTPETDIWTTRDGKNKSYATPEKYDGATNVLFRNNGDGTFADVSKQAGVFNPAGKSMSVVADDFNEDGWPDLVVTNDTQPNFLYMNQKNGSFIDMALSAGVAYDENGLARAGMGVDVADLELKGSKSIAIGNFSGEPISLYTQMGHDTFLDKAGPFRLARPTEVMLTFGVRFADFNLDGYVDLFLANGHIEPEIEIVRKDWSFAQPPQLFLNNGSGQFIEAGPDAGEPFQSKIVGRAVAVADIDVDGDLDVLLTTNGGSPKLLRNDLDRAHGPLRVRLIGSGKNREAIGARLILTTPDGQTQRRTIRTGGSYLSQSELTATFGLANQQSAAALEVHWPTGASDRFENLAADSLYVIEFGKGIVSVSRLSGQPLPAPR